MLLCCPPSSAVCHILDGHVSPAAPTHSAVLARCTSPASAVIAGCLPPQLWTVSCATSPQHGMGIRPLWSSPSPLPASWCGALVAPTAVALASLHRLLGSAQREAEGYTHMGASPAPEHVAHMGNSLSL
eukprot:GGOE01047910.1.p2 GENE.GGOE01047910.1~~GGOE01047910.1.p2  ORF type:complete len:129 (+),score=0.27 GGOE01047910.1:262-648(+)